MTANPFAALLDGKFQEHATMHRDAGDMNGYRAIIGVASAVHEALSAAVPADLAEAGKMAYECFEAVSGEGPRAYDWTDKPHRLVYDMYDTIRSLIATATAQAARIEAYQESHLHADKQLLHAKTALAASDARVAKLALAQEALKHYRETLCEGFCKGDVWADEGHSHPDIQRDCGGCLAASVLINCAAIKEAKK